MPGLDEDLCCEDEGKAKEIFSTFPITHLDAREREVQPQQSDPAIAFACW